MAATCLRKRAQAHTQQTHSSTLTCDDLVRAQWTHSCTSSSTPVTEKHPSKRQTGTIARNLHHYQQRQMSSLIFFPPFLITFPPSPLSPPPSLIPFPTCSSFPSNPYLQDDTFQHTCSSLATPDSEVVRLLSASLLLPGM